MAQTRGVFFLGRAYRGIDWLQEAWTGVQRSEAGWVKGTMNLESFLWRGFFEHTGGRASGDSARLKGADDREDLGWVVAFEVWWE